MLVAFWVAVLLIVLGLVFSALTFKAASSPIPAAPRTSGIVIEGSRVEAAADTKLKVRIQYDGNGRVTVVELN